MKLAFKFNELEEDITEGKETVLFRAQMLRDVYRHEGDTLPDVDDFISEPLTRSNGLKFWVYRQGTYIDSSVIFSDEIYVGHAFTSELNASPEPTLEGYHHIDTLFLQFGGKLSVSPGVRYTAIQQLEYLEELHEMIQNY
jgi:hypothetical protein